MTNLTTQRLAAGPGGPRSLRKRRKDQVDATTLAIKEACAAVAGRERRPSIDLVATESGYSRSTVNRKRYKELLRQAKLQFDLKLSGHSKADSADCEGVASTAEIYTLPTSSEPNSALSSPTPSPVAEIQILLEKNEQLQAEVRRRDDQLYHALGEVHGLRRTLQWHRRNSAKLSRQLEALEEEPLDERTPQKWSEDFESVPFEDEDED